jgi:hypothetical protein
MTSTSVLKGLVKYTWRGGGGELSLSSVSPLLPYKGAIGTGMRAIIGSRSSVTLTLRQRSLYVD